MPPGVSTHPSPANISPTNMHVSMGSATMLISRVIASPFFASNEGSFLSFFFSPIVGNRQHLQQLSGLLCTHGCSQYAMFASTLLYLSELLELAHGQLGQRLCVSVSAWASVETSRVVLFPLVVEMQRLLQLSDGVMVPVNPGCLKTHTCLNDISAHVDEMWEVEIVVAIS